MHLWLKQIRLFLFQRRERQPVDGTRAVFRDGRQMFRRAIALVPVETVGGKLQMIFQHQPVARDLGENAGGGDGITPRVALDDGRLLHAQRLHRAAVHERVRWQRTQLRQRVVHGAMRGLEDIDLVNHRRAHPGDAEFDVAAAGDVLEILFPLRLRKLFGIVQSGKFLR